MSSSSGREHVVAIVQARMGSTRLPGKMMADVAGKPVLRWVLERLQLARSLDSIVVATTDQPRDDAIVELVQKMAVQVFRGSEEDVLERYVMAARGNNADIIVRICGEDVLVDPNLVDSLVNLHRTHRPDYTTNAVNRTYPEGLYAEVVTLETLEKVHQLATSNRHREHVTLFILENPNLFRIKSLEASGRLRRPDISVAVDTPEDLEFVRMVYSTLYQNGELIQIDDVLDFLETPAANTISQRSDEFHSSPKFADGAGKTP